MPVQNRGELRREYGMERPKRWRRDTAALGLFFLFSSLPSFLLSSTPTFPLFFPCSFFFNNLICLFYLLFCVWSLAALGLRCPTPAFSVWGAVASLAEHRLSHCAAWAYWPWHVGSSRIGEQTWVSCRQILYHWATREAPHPFFDPK